MLMLLFIVKIMNNQKRLYLLIKQTIFFGTYILLATSCSVAIFISAMLVLLFIKSEN